MQKYLLIISWMIKRGFYPFILWGRLTMEYISNEKQSCMLILVLAHATTLRALRNMLYSIYLNDVKFSFSFGVYMNYMQWNSRNSYIEWKGQIIWNHICQVTLHQQDIFSFFHFNHTHSSKQRLNVRFCVLIPLFSAGQN